MLCLIKFNFLVWVAVVFHVLSSGVSAAYNYTVDDADGSIVYIGKWLTTTSSERYMSTTHYTRTQASYATFAFTGAIQIHYMGLGNTRTDVDTNIQIVLDGQSHIVDIYREAGEHLQAILWSSDTLDPTVKHAIECRKISDDGGGRDLNVDAFILTISDVAAPPAVSNPLAQTNSSASSTASPLTIVNSSNSAGVNATGLSIATGGATTTLFSIVWTPPSVHDPVSTPDLQSDGTIQAPVGGSSSSNVLSKATIVGIAFGAFALLCLIAIIFFFLGRRRHQVERLEMFQHNDSSSPDSKMVTEVEEGADPFVLSGILQSSTKQGRYDEAPYREEPLSPISSGYTRTRSSYLETSYIAPESFTHTSESDMRINRPPAYTFRPTSGLTSITASGLVRVRLHNATLDTRDIKEIRPL